MMHSVNDAVLVPCGGAHTIARVIAFTQGGCAIVEMSLDDVCVEKEPEEWPKVGKFVRKRRRPLRCLLRWLFFGRLRFEPDADAYVYRRNCVPSKEEDQKIEVHDEKRMMFG